MTKCHAGHYNRQERDTLLLGDETALYTDAASNLEETRKKLKRYGIQDQAQRRGCRNKPQSHNDQLRNRMIASTRSGGERPFVTYKQH